LHGRKEQKFKTDCEEAKGHPLRICIEKEGGKTADYLDIARSYDRLKQYSNTWIGIGNGVFEKNS
jgi:hypothetical protein